MRYRHRQRILAVVLCFALLLPNFAGLVAAAPAVNAQSVMTNSKWVPVSDPFASGEIPAYQTKGTISSEALVMDGGNGITNDGAKTYMKLVTGTSATEMITYVSTLQNAGFTRTTSRILQADAAGNNNLFYHFLSPNKNYTLTVYYLHAYKEVRIIVDTAEDMVKSFSGGFVYQSTTNEVAQTMMTMYGLSMSPNGYDNTSKTAYRTGARNCGALVVIRMPDNSLFINDGGDIEQWSDEFCEEFMTFCRELTGKAEGEKVVINTWFMSHAHSDHFDGIPRFFDRYHDSIDILNVMYNIDDERLGTTRDISAVMQMISGYFPNVKYYQPHTGDHFDIAGVQFDVLYTQEDRFIHNSQNKMVIDIRDGDETNTNENRDGTYRDFLYEESTIENLSDFNDTTAVLKVTFPSGITKGEEVTSILYGDVNLADQVLIDIWPASTLETDIMMVPHHGHDAHPELVAMSNANIFMYTQVKNAIYGPNGVVDEDVDLPGSYRPALVQNFLAMHDINGKKYFDTTATCKTYWEGTETACILFGENTVFENLPSGLSRDSEDPAGFTVYTKDAPFFEYGGWLSVSRVHESGSVNTTKTTTSNVIYAQGVELKADKTDNNTLTEGALYAIVHNKTNKVMSYDAMVYNASTGIKHPAVAHSVAIGSQAAGSQVYFNSTNGVLRDDVIYFSHDMREAFLWELDFTQFDGATMNYNASSAKLGGNSEEYYHRSMFLKGVNSAAAPFWSLTSSTAANAFRVLQPNIQYVFRTPTSSLNDGQSGISYNIRVEFFANDSTTDVDGDGVVDVCDTCVIFYHDNTNANDFRVLTVDENGNWVRKRYNSASEVKSDLENVKLRLYRYETGSDKRKVTITGQSQFDVLKNTSMTSVADYIPNYLTVTDSQGLTIACSGTSAKTGYYWLDLSGYNGVNDCTATVKYRNDDGTDTLLTTLTIKMQDYFEMLAAYNDDDTVYAGTRYGSKFGFLYLDEGVIYEEVVNHTNRMDMTVNLFEAVSGVTSTTINITPSMLTYSNGNPVNFNLPGEYTNLSLNYNGKVIDTGFNIRVAATAEDLSYPATGEPGSVTVNKQGLTIPADFMATGIANIQLSATGVPEDKGVDLIIVMDLSGSMKNGLDTNVDAVAGQQSRIDAMEKSLKSIIEGMQASNMDIRIAMSDFGDLDHYTFGDSVSDKSLRYEPFYDITNNNTFNQAYDFYNHLNWLIKGDDPMPGAFSLVGHKYNQAHSQYTGVVTPEVYTGSKVVNAGAFVDIDSLTEDVMGDIISKMEENVNHALGTNYDIGLEYAYRLGYAIQNENTSHGEDRDVVCIFMSDGAAIQYNYFSGNSKSSAWSEYLMGTPDDIQSLAEYYANQGNWPEQIEQMSKVMLNLLVTKETATSQYLRDYSLLKAPEYRNQDISSRYPEFNDRYFVYKPYLTRDTALYFYTYMDDQGYDLYDWKFLYDLAVANGYEQHIGQKFTPELYHSSHENKVLQYLVDKLTTPRGDILYKTDDQGNPVYETDANGNIIYEKDENGQMQPVQVVYFQSQLENPYYRDGGRYDPTNPDHADELLVSADKYYLLSNATVDDSKSYTDQFFAAMKAIGVPCDWSLYARIAEMNKGSIQKEYGYANPRDVIRTLIETVKTPVAGYGEYQTLSPYDYFYHADGKNWWAEAMKGDSDQLYPVINKYAFDDNPAWTNAYYGDVRNGFSTGTGLKLDGKDYISGFRGLEMDLYTISFSISDDELLTTEVAQTVLKNVASGPNYFYSASSQEDLTEVLQTITSTMSTAATRGWFTDTMGPDFDLSTEKYVLSHDGTMVLVNGNPSIRVMEYDLIKTIGANGAVTYVRSQTPRIIETVTFEDLDGDGDVDAWSDQIFTTTEVGGVVQHDKIDIWDESTGLISAMKFYYNTNTDKSVQIAFGEQGSYPLAPESFFWIIGGIGQTEMVLDYQVYLTGSIEGDRLLTNSDYYHATNSQAVLHYINYLGQDCTRDTVSPQYPWGDGKVGYGYYLVNKNGQIIADQRTGATTTDFSKAVKLTMPIYEYLQWNGDYTVASGAVTAAKYRPDGYTLYSPTAGYSVTMAMDGHGGWTISDPKSSTYVVTQGSNYHASQSFGSGAYMTGQTVVWFAVVVDQFSTAPDTVVIDYGIPVDIDVLGNDDTAIGNRGTLAAFGNYTTKIDFSGIILNQGYAAGSYSGTYGSASIHNNKIHYQLDSMQMNGVEKFNYAVYYTARFGDTGLNGYYYNTVTVIPATTIYFEDNFAQYHTYKYNSGKYVLSADNKWTVAQDANFNTLQGAHQDQDRPGAGLPEIDADNIYGFDSAYAGCSQYSLGSAMKFTANQNDAGTVTFSFYGTGFDVVSLTNSNTGTIMVDVYNAEGYVQDQSTPVHSYSVDTYYGYTYNAQNKSWEVTPNSDTLYQVPVMKVSGLNYGHYTAVITVAYADFFDHNKADASYEFYMDAVRIYNPAGSNQTADDAYVQDGEYKPVYEELRNILISERNFYDSTANLGAGYLHGAVFIDGIPTLDSNHYDEAFRKDPPEIGTYLNYGPNNEVYLAPGQAIAFELNGMTGLKAAHMALKSTGGTAKIKIFSASKSLASTALTEITTATDRYYDLTDLVGQTVIIANVGTAGDGILSVTNIKLTTDPTASQAVRVSDVVRMSRPAADSALSALTDSNNQGSVPETGDEGMQLMNCLILLACLCMSAVVVLVYMDGRVRKTYQKR